MRFQLAAIHVSLGETDRGSTMLEAIAKEAPSFIEARVSLATVYYRLKLRDLGDKERAVVDELNRKPRQSAWRGWAPTAAHAAGSDAMARSIARLRSCSSRSSLRRWRKRRPPRKRPDRRGRPTFRAATTAVMLDVVVRDKKGRPVPDLRQDEITVLEDGAPRELKAFRWSRAHPPTAA